MQGQFLPRTRTKNRTRKRVLVPADCLQNLLNLHGILSPDSLPTHGGSRSAGRDLLHRFHLAIFPGIHGNRAVEAPTLILFSNTPISS